MDRNEAVVFCGSIEHRKSSIAQGDGWIGRSDAQGRVWRRERERWNGQDSGEAR